MSDKKTLTAVLSAFMICFYIAIVMYIFFEVIHIEILSNFATALTFETIGFVILACFILINILSDHFKIGYFVPLIIVTTTYTIFLDLINIIFVASIPHTLFVLMNLILLFIYCLVSIPMYIMGRR